MYKKKSRISGPGTCRVGLKKLSAVLLNSRIQEGSHCSVEDAVHTMKLYLLVRDQWETQLAHSPNSTSEDELSSTLYNNSSQYLDDFFWTSANQI
ncbi:AEN [Bugula neritina]|uniref:AEN n=1 Tax=Bugula neritina TaxID=10212 RepID=A0A7J7JS44_BUGNE|nr:AEN [Bugula neritina]